MKLRFIQKNLEKLFYQYGVIIGRHPLPFLLVPIFITLCAAMGMARFTFINDSEFLYTPKNGQAKTERKFFIDNFPEDQENYFSAARKNTEDGSLIVLIAKSANGGNVFSKAAIQYAIDVDAAIKKISVAYNEEILTYGQICAKRNGSCSINAFLEILNYKAENIETINITFPFHFSVFLGNALGGVTTNQQGVVINAEMISMPYFAKCVNDIDIEKANLWLGAVKEYLLEQENQEKLFFYTTISPDEEVQLNQFSLAPKFAAAFVILLLFCILSCMSSDWVFSTPWVAVGGEVSAFMATITAFGLCMACGLPLYISLGVTPFIVIGIGVDDMFVMVSSWRHTNPPKSVEERMGQMMSTAAVSITITSLTDTLAFVFSCMSPFPSVFYFSAVTTIGIVLSYIYAITFLAACMVYSGLREANGLHVITCRKAVPKSESGNRSRLYRWFCTGGRQQTETSPSSNGERRSDVLSNDEITLVAKFFKIHYAPFIHRVPVRIVVFLLYVLYIAFGIWGCSILTVGIPIKYQFPSNSYLRHYFIKLEDNFADKYGPQVMVGINGTIDYSNKHIREDILKNIDNIKTLNYFIYAPEMVTSWLRDFTFYLEQSEQDPHDMGDFINILTSDFFNLPEYEYLRADVVFNSEKTEIISSRFLFQTYGVNSTFAEQGLMQGIRKYCQESKYNLVPYHYNFIFYEQNTPTVSNTIKTIGIAVAAVFVVAIVLLANVTAILWVTVSVVSIFTGVVGYLSLWGGTLDFSTTFHLAICVGFSVDFSVHVSYHYVSSAEKKSIVKIEQCLAYLGHPILQGMLSTVLAVVILSTSQDYTFFALFKVILLVMVIGFVHGVLFIPVVLATMSDIGEAIGRKRNKKETNKENRRNDKERMKPKDKPKQAWSISIPD